MLLLKVVMTVSMTYWRCPPSSAIIISDLRCMSGGQLELLIFRRNAEISEVGTCRARWRRVVIGVGEMGVVTGTVFLCCGK